MSPEQKSLIHSQDTVVGGGERACSCGLGRRSLTRAAAWSVPALAVAAAAPATATSPGACTPVMTWVEGTFPNDNDDVDRNKDPLMSSAGASGSSGASGSTSGAMDLSIDGWFQSRAVPQSGYLRVVFGTVQPLTDVTLTLTLRRAPEDVGFTSGEWNTLSSPSPVLTALGFNQPVPDTGAVTVDYRTVTWTIPQMPASSSVSVNIPWTATDSVLSTTNQIVALLEMSATRC